MAVSFVLLVLLVTGPSHAVRPRTANSTARTSRIPNVYGPQDDRTAKMTLGPPTPAGGLVVRSSCSLVVLAPLSGTLASTLSGTLSQTPSPSWLSFLGTLGTLARFKYSPPGKQLPASSCGPVARW